MAVKSGEWVMDGIGWDDPLRIGSYQELIQLINEIGFLPLFKNEIKAFSVEERTSELFWWTGDKEHDPWEWRELIARSKEVIYGKFFNKKAGFVSKEWFPYFVNYRRDGYDFDARWEDGLANIRCKKIMDTFESKTEFTSFELKHQAGFEKGGEKNFNGIVTELQMQTYLTVTDFRRRRSKKGEEYGMPVSVYTKPEDIWGYEMVSAAYKESPIQSRERILDHIKERYVDASEAKIRKLI